MDKITRLRQEIERLRQVYYNKESEWESRSDDRHGYAIWYEGKVHMCDELLSFLDTLSEEPDKNLEEAAGEYAFIDMTAYNAFIDGAEWQASQMPMPEDTALFNKGVAEGRRLERDDMLKDAIPFYEILRTVPSLERENTRIIVVKYESK